MNSEFEEEEKHQFQTLCEEHKHSRETISKGIEEKESLSCQKLAEQINKFKLEIEQKRQQLFSLRKEYFEKRCNSALQTQKLDEASIGKNLCTAPSLEDEENRLRALHQYRILDSDTNDTNFNRTTTMATALFNMPISVISLVDKYRLWFKSIVGMQATQVIRNGSFCSFSILQNAVTVINDTHEDERFKNHWLVVQPPHVRFYAAAPLIVNFQGKKYNVGTFCVIDTVPRSFTKEQVGLLQSMADIVVREMELYKHMYMAQQAAIYHISLRDLIRTINQQQDLETMHQYTALAITERVNSDYSLVMMKIGKEVQGTLVKMVECLPVTSSQQQVLLPLLNANKDLYNLSDTNIMEESYAVDFYKLLSGQKIRSALLAPIRLDGKAVGLVGAMQTDPFDWTEPEQDYILNLAKGMSSALERQIYVSELANEKKKTEALLDTILPSFISHRLKQQETSIADPVYSASIVFADVVGFTSLSTKVSPLELVSMLERIFSEFDKVASKYGMEKIKTIGDCYMAAAGLFSHEYDHAIAAVRFALEIAEVIKDPKIQAFGNINIRIGISSGSCIAGVLAGSQKPLFDVWGDTVNTASRMESSGVAGKVHLSEATRSLILHQIHPDDEDKWFTLEERGNVDIKGKGVMKTFFAHPVTTKPSTSAVSFGSSSPKRSRVESKMDVHDYTDGSPKKQRMERSCL